MEKVSSDNNKKRILTLSRGYRFFIFFIVVTIEGAMNIPGGLLSSATKEIKKSLNMNDSKFGMFGTANGIGRVLGSAFFGMYNLKFSRKWMEAINTGVYAVVILFFKLTNNGNFLIVMRGFTGFTQMTPSIYACVWINQFGIEKYKAVQLTAVQLSQTSGKCFGYFLNMIFGLENWKEGFLYAAIYLFFGFIICAVSSEDYFSRTLYPKGSDPNKISIKKKISNNKIRQEKEEERKSTCTIFEDKTISEKEKNSTFYQDILLLLGNPLYILSLISRCILHGLNTCLHFWLVDFIRTEDPEETQGNITIAYTIICLLGPIGGMMMNAILRPFIGGYDTRTASWPLVILQIIASFLAIRISMMKSLFSISFTTILYLIFNSAALPLVHGILISCVDKDLSATGFALASILTQSLTSGSTPYLYGVINDRYKKKYKWLAMFSIMCIQFIAVPVLILLAILRNREFDRQEKLLEEQEKEEELKDRDDDRV